MKSFGRQIAFFAFWFPALLLYAFPLPAQEVIPGEAVSDYRLDENGRILQRLSWSRSNANFFEAEIERQIGPDLWEPTTKERTTELFIEISLPPGLYRYRVLSYNVLGRVAASSEWVGMRIFVAKWPVVESLNPAAYYFDIPSATIVVTIAGSDLSEEAEVYLAEKTGERRRKDPLSVFYSTDEKNIEVVFSTADLTLALYEIVVANPGGLHARTDFAAGFSRKTDITLSLGYSPLLPLYGYVFDSFSKGFYPAGFYGRVGVVPFKRLWGFIGLELTPRFALMTTEEDDYRVNGTMTALTLSGLCQYWFKGYTMALKLRLGGGAAALTGIQYEHKGGSMSEKVATVLVFASAGASFEWLLASRGLFMEAGAEYIQAFSPNNPAPGFVQISLGVGWKF